MYSIENASVTVREELPLVHVIGGIVRACYVDSINMPEIRSYIAIFRCRCTRPGIIVVLEVLLQGEFVKVCPSLPKRKLAAYLDGRNRTRHLTARKRCTHRMIDSHLFPEGKQQGIVVSLPEDRTG